MLDVAAPPDDFTRAPRASGSDRPLRVLIASYRSHPHVGGQGVYVRELSRALLAEGARVDVVSGQPYPDLAPGVGLIKLPSLDLFMEDNAFSAFRPHFVRSWPDFAEWTLHNTGAFGEPYAFGQRLKIWLRDHASNHDVVHDNQGLFTGLLEAQRGLPVVATVHHPISIDLDLALERADGAIDRVLLRRWHAFVRTQARVARALPAMLTVSEASKRAVVRDFRVDSERVSVAFNGLDHATFHPDPSVARDPDLIAATTSADTPIKGLNDLIRAFARIARERPNTRLDVVGSLRDGPAKKTLEASGVANRVRFLSNVATGELVDLYRRAGLFIVPSLFEGFGFPAAEAMACGACVLATNGGALPEVVGDAGVITPAGDPDALATAAVELLDAPERRAALGLAAATRAATAFSWSAHARAALALYQKAGVHAHRLAV